MCKKIKSCPRCGYAKPKVLRIRTKKVPEFFVECPRCLCAGADKVGFRRAIRAWNRLKWPKSGEV